MTKFERLNNQNFDYKANSHRVGVFLRCPGKPALPAPNHVGLLFTDPTGTTREFDFSTNYRIGREVLKPTKSYFHAPIGFDAINASGFAAYLSVFLQDNKLPQIKYGMDWFAVLGAFDDEGKYRYEGDDDPGMTCATFVSELFAGFGHPIVNFHEWDSDIPSDLQWREKKLEGFRERASLSLEQIEAIERISPFVRLRPQEVAAVAAEDFEAWESLKYKREPVLEGQAQIIGLDATVQELAAEVVRAFEDAFSK
jgi:hypothetical protein